MDLRYAFDDGIHFEPFCDSNSYAMFESYSAIRNGWYKRMFLARSNVRTRSTAVAQACTANVLPNQFFGGKMGNFHS
jgi:hypothetical protein